MATEQSTTQEIDSAELKALLAMDSTIFQETKKVEKKEPPAAKKPPVAKTQEEQEEEEVEEVDENKAKNPVSTLDSLIEGVDNEKEEEEQEEDQPGQATTKVPRNSARAIQMLVDADIIKEFEFEEGKEKKISEYTDKELADLVKENIALHSTNSGSKAVQELMEGLSPTLQAAIEYQRNGGTEVNRIFRQLAAVEEVSDLDLATSAGKENTIRAYLSEISKLTPDEVEADLADIKDRQKLDDLAKRYHPKIREHRENEAAAIVEKQQREYKAIQEQTAKINKQVEAVLLKGELAGQKLDHSTQSMLYAGLTRNVGELGQIVSRLGVKADISHLLQVMWLLQDPKSFMEKFATATKNEHSEEVHKKLRTTAQGETRSRNPDMPLGGKPAGNPGTKIKRPPGNIFRKI